LLACGGVVLAREAESPDGPSSTPRQPVKSEVIPDRYIVVLEDDGGGETAAQASADRRQAGQVADDLIQEDKVQEVSQAYGAALKGFAAEIPTGKIGAVRSDPRVAFVAEDRKVYASVQTLPKGVDRVDADSEQTAWTPTTGAGP
jgi:peptidase inhibitor I9